MSGFGDIGKLNLQSSGIGLGSTQKSETGIKFTPEQEARLKKGIAEFKSGKLSLSNMLANPPKQDSATAGINVKLTPEQVAKAKKEIADLGSDKLSLSGMLSKTSKQDLIKVDSDLGKKLQAHFEARGNKPVAWLQKDELDGYVPVYEPIDNGSPWPSQKLVGYRPKTEQENNGTIYYKS